MIKNIITDLQFSKLLRNINNSNYHIPMFNIKRLDYKKLNYFKLFNFNQKNTPKIISILKDENNQNKIIYKDYDEYKNEHLKNNIIPDQNEKPKKRENFKSKLKIFGEAEVQMDKIDDLSNLKNRNDINNKDDILNVFDESESNNKEINDSENTEELNDNILNYNSFYSDYCRIYVKAGEGGNGSISVLKGPMFDQISPQGGDGGKGGNIILEADEKISSLARLRRAHFLGNDGENGYIKAQDGKNGKDLAIYLPVGTVVYEMVRDENYSFMKKDLRKLLVDLDTHGKRFTICKGGQGGIGNFTKRSLRKGDKLLQGAKGEEKELELVLKCLADVGFIGFPNAGKSTLLAALTRAVPKIASYPFTTMHPHMGKLRYKEDKTLSLADLPGLIEGAHMNKGLGHKFLKHVERTKVLLFLLDGSLNPEYNKNREPYKDYLTLKKELELYDINISKKPSIIVFNKLDVDEELFEKNVKNFYENICIEPIRISAKTGEGLEDLTEKIIEKFDEFLLLNKVL